MAWTVPVLAKPLPVPLPLPPGPRPFPHSSPAFLADLLSTSEPGLWITSFPALPMAPLVYMVQADTALKPPKLIVINPAFSGSVTACLTPAFAAAAPQLLIPSRVI